MKILLVSIGTRGDMEPFLGIGEILKEKRHEVIAAFPEQFRSLAEESGIEFASLGSEYIDSLKGELADQAMGMSGSTLEKVLANVKLAGRQWSINREMIRRQFDIIEGCQPDRVLYNGKAIYPIIWGLDRDEEHIMICSAPYMHHVRDHAHVAFNGDFGPLINWLTYFMADIGLIFTLWISARWLGVASAISWRKMWQSFRTSKVAYAISPSLFPRPDYWPDNIQVLGFHQRGYSEGWRPSEGLKAFLEAHGDERLVLITFGSMSNPNPEEKTKIILQALERNKISAIVNTGSGGLVKLDGTNAGKVHFLSQVPYEWIFPDMYAVVHHGGSGTTHMALRHGCASMIIPHVGDQFAWDTVIQDKGVGPEGVRIEKISIDNLEPKLRDLVNNGSLKSASEQLSRQMKAEDLREEIYRFIIQT